MAADTDADADADADADTDTLSKSEALAALGISRYKFRMIARDLGIMPLGRARDFRVRLYAREDVERMRVELDRPVTRSRTRR